MSSDVIFYFQGLAQGVFCQFSEEFAAFAHLATPVIFAQALLIHAYLAQYGPLLFGKAVCHALKIDQCTFGEVETESTAESIFAECTVEWQFGDESIVIV